MQYSLNYQSMPFQLWLFLYLITFWCKRIFMASFSWAMNWERFSSCKYTPTYRLLMVILVFDESSCKSETYLFDKYVPSYRYRLLIHMLHFLLLLNKLFSFRNISSIITHFKFYSQPIINFYLYNGLDKPAFFIIFVKYWVFSNFPLIQFVMDKTKIINTNLITIWGICD